MRFLTVLATVFSACCCFSILSLFSFDTSGLKSDPFYRAKRDLLNNTPTDEEILRCQKFLFKIVKHLNQRPTEEELQDILSQCSLFSQQNSKVFGSKNENDSTRSPPFENHRSQEHDFTTEEHSRIESSKEVNSQNTGANEILKGTYESKENDSNSNSEPSSDKNEDLKDIFTDRIEPTTDSSGLWSLFYRSKGTKKSEATSKDPGDHEDLQMMSTTINPKPTAKSSGLWSLLFRNERSSGNSGSVPVTEQIEGSSTEKPTDKHENQKTKFNTVILNLTNTSRSLWNYLFVMSDSSNSSNGSRPFKNLERGPITESGIYFENSTHLKYSTTETAVIWNIIMPGTKWCGSGDIAANDDDLGFFEDVDRCCRAHDKCDDLMIPGESKYNLTNTSPFTVLNCKCDDELYECLRQIDSAASNTLGNTFFNIIGRMCYTLDYPRICKKYYALLGCQEYVIDETAEKVFQWKPAKKYLKMPFTIPGR